VRGENDVVPPMRIVPRSTDLVYYLTRDQPIYFPKPVRAKGRSPSEMR